MDCNIFRPRCVVSPVHTYIAMVVLSVTIQLLLYLFTHITSAISASRIHLCLVTSNLHHPGSRSCPYVYKKSGFYCFSSPFHLYSRRSKSKKYVQPPVSHSTSTVYMYTEDSGERIIADVANTEVSAVHKLFCSNNGWL